MFATQTILIVVIVSGIIAYIGNIVGRKIGKRRLTIFGLRPKYTAIAITVITGSLIALFTGTILSVISSDARTALFGLDRLRYLISSTNTELKTIRTERQQLVDDITSLKKTLSASKKEILDLTKTKESLTNEIKTARSGRLLYKVNDIITAAVINSTGSQDDTKVKLLKILSDTDKEIKDNIRGDKKHYIVMNDEEFNQASDYIIKHPGSTIVRLVAAGNIVSGDDIPVHFELFENVLVFKKGDLVSSAIVNGKRTQPEIEQKIKDLLSQVNEIAIRKGIVPDPAGSVGSIPYSRIFEVSKAIKARNAAVPLDVEVQKDVFTVGPLNIDLKIKN